MQQEVARISSEHEEQVKRATDRIQKELAESIMRAGLLTPVIAQEDILKLEKETHFIGITDTGMLRRGTMTYLHGLFSPKRAIWTSIPIIAMMELQNNAERLKSIMDSARKKQELKYFEAIYRRPSVSCAMWELAYLRANYPTDVLSLDPALMRQMPGLNEKGEQAGSEKSFYQDRMIIECVKTLKRDRAVEKGYFLLTGDKTMATFAEAENIPNIYIDVPSLPSEVFSVRYNLYQQRFVVCPLMKFVWDLTGVYSKIRLTRDDESSGITFNLYHSQQQRYLDDRLEVTTYGPDFAPAPA